MATTTTAETTTTAAGLDAFNPATPYLTPTERFFRIDSWSFPTTDFVDDWVLQVNGRVDRPLSLTLADLQAMAQVEHEATIACVSNYVGGQLIGNAVWGGIRLSDVLAAAGVQADAEQVFCTGVDGFTCGFPVGAALDGRNALLALTMNGEPLPLEHGYPARLVIPGLYGYVSAAKWLTEIRLTTWEEAEGSWITIGWDRDGLVRSQCRIDLPRQGQAVAPGETFIAGVAWAPPVGVGRVEVQVDDGPWLEAELDDRGTNETWRQWRLAWTATAGSHLIRARVTDLDGIVQTDVPSTPAPSGATGYPTRGLSVRG